MPGQAPDDTPTSGTGGPNAAQNVVVVDQLPLTNKKMVVQFLSPSCTYTAGKCAFGEVHDGLPCGRYVLVTYEIQVQI